MTNTFKPTKITDSVHWVGAVDWNIRDFHGYKTGRGSTYNAFLVMADNIALIDTVKAPFKNEMMERIAAVTDPGKIDYIISNHSEMDHSGALAEVIEAVKPEKVFASAMGKKALDAHFGIGDKITAVKNGETLSLGNLSLSFLETKMLHWPDSMFSYLAEEKVLFSQDAFGMHLASSERFADEINDALLYEEGARYFANILLPYSPLVTKLLKEVSAMDLAIDIIAPDHGPVWRGNLDKIIGRYEKWAAQKPSKKAVVLYDTMWNSTEKMARAISEGLIENGISVKSMRASVTHRSDVMAEILEAGALVVGSSTINNGMLPKMADFLTYIKGLKPQNKIGAAFGSYGWSGEATKQIAETLEAMKVNMVGEPLRVAYVPDGAALEKCRELGGAIAAKLKETCK